MTSPEPTAPVTDIELHTRFGGSSTLAEITAANARFMEAFRAGDADGIAACYTPDAQLLPAGSEAIAGTADIATFWRGAISAGIAAARLETVELEEAGHLAVEIGRYTLSGADGAPVDRGKYLVVWRRVDGAWRLHRDIWTTSVAPQQS